jgi:PEGA domain
MYLNAMRMRLLWVGAMVLLLIFAVYYGGSAVFGIQTAISIEWGIDQDLVGSVVEVDGKAVGKLEKYGQATRTGFPVSPGKHTVRLVTDAYECPPREVEVKRGERLHLLLDFEDYTNAQGGISPRITFR